MALTAFQTVPWFRVTPYLFLLLRYKVGEVDKQVNSFETNMSKPGIIFNMLCHKFSLVSCEFFVILAK